MRMALDAVLFDCDGVLADTERDGHRVSFNLTFREYAIPAEWDVNQYGRLLQVGGGKERMTAYFNEIGWPPVAQTPAERRDLVRRLHARKTELFMELVTGGKIPLRPGVVSLVDEALAAGCQVGVCSTSNERAVTAIVGLMGAERAAHVRVFAGDVVRRKKPAPDIYELGARELGVSPRADGSSRVVIVEDSRIGLESALAAGMPCAITKSAYTRFESFDNADAVFEQLAKDNVTLSTLEQIAEDHARRQRRSAVP